MDVILWQTDNSAEVFINLVLLYSIRMIVGPNVKDKMESPKENRV